MYCLRRHGTVPLYHIKPQSFGFGLSLQAAPCHTVDDVLAGEEEEDQHRQNDDGRGCHHHFIACAAFGDEVIKTEGQRADIGGTGSQHRPEERVPAGNRVQQDDRHQRRFRHRHHHPPQVFPVRTPIHPGRLIKRIRHRVEEILQNVSVKDTGHERDDQRPERIMDIPLNDCAVVGDDQHLERHHHHRQQRSENCRAAREIQPGKGKSTQNRGEGTDRHGADDDDQRVQKITRKGSRLQRKFIIRQIQRTRQPFWRKSNPHVIILNFFKCFKINYF